ncbi:hypothetical protein [Sphingomonas sp. S2-65]|uniref:hypothetical protein n=1 Tax=Sphingomonas sp. S2-65 TaxID=2903960 RepID=UPI001F1A4B3F|nr:hypothetical protein [Sphingomonas sp. S2-65]UYY57100.1 hypothetical protein LZ586_10410 [Sphingomonas sp. S2-65]
MAEGPEFYRERAREQRAAAEAATLVNVRARCIHAAENWERMAERGEGISRRQALSVKSEIATQPPI